MSAAAFCGLLLLGCGPIAACFVVALARKSFLVLVTLGRWVRCGVAQRRSGAPAAAAARRRRPLAACARRLHFDCAPAPSPHPCSAFYWLCTLFLISAIFRG